MYKVNITAGNHSSIHNILVKQNPIHNLLMYHVVVYITWNILELN